MAVTLGGFNMWGGGYYTQEDVDRSNAALAQIAESNPDIDLSSFGIGPSAEVEAASAAIVAQQEAEAAEAAELEAGEAVEAEEAARAAGLRVG